MKIELYEPAMCCESGVCGPNVNPVLLMITSVFEALDDVDQVEAHRYNLSQNPDAFANNQAVLDIVAESTDNLPLTVVDGKVMKRGAYPTPNELGEYTGLVFVPQDSDGGCCGGNGCCGGGC